MHIKQPSVRVYVCLIISLWAGITAAQAPLESQYHPNLSGELIDLYQWSRDYTERCLALSELQTVRPITSEINAALSYLSQDETFADYLISNAQQAGTLICIDNRADGTRGYYDYHYNIIVIREHLSHMQKVAIILHELRHIDQVRRGYRPTLDYSMREAVRLNFAAEADVHAFSALVAWRLKENDEPGLWDALISFERYADIALNFKNSIAQGLSEELSTRQAFIQWYQSAWRIERYRQNCCSRYLDMLDESKRIENYDNLPDNYFDQLCLLPDGKNYGCHKTDAIEKRH